MRALEMLGDRAGAIRQARLHEVLIEEEFGAEPDAAVRALAARIRAGEDDTAVEGEGAAAGVHVDEGEGQGGDEGGGIGFADDGGAGHSGSAIARTGADHGRGRASTSGAVKPRSPRRSWKRRGWVAVALLLVGMMVWASTRGRSANAAGLTRIAVLPLANLTGDPGQEYFVAGMHDALISELAKIGTLVVYSRQSVLRYADSDLPLPVIAKELGVDALVEGAVFKSGDNVHIQRQIVARAPAAAGQVARAGPSAHRTAHASSSATPARDARCAGAPVEHSSRRPHAHERIPGRLYRGPRGNGQSLPAILTGEPDGAPPEA